MSHEQSVISRAADEPPRQWLVAKIWFALAVSLLLSAPAHGETLRIVMLGDSLAAGLGVAPSQAFPVRLQAELAERGFDVEIANAGVSGDTTAGGLARLDWAVSEGVDGVIVELGANDALRGLPVETTRINLDAILSRLGERGIPVLLAGMLAPPNMGETYRRAFDAIFPALAQKHDVTLYPFFLDGVAASAELNQADGKHPNEKGVDEMVRRFAPVASEWLEAISPKSGGSG